jgi:hypothetical protein
MVSKFISITASECLVVEVLGVVGNGVCTKSRQSDLCCHWELIRNDVPVHLAMVQSALHRSEKLVYSRIAYFHSLTRNTCSLTMFFPSALLFTTFVSPSTSRAPPPDFTTDDLGLGLGDGSGPGSST